ncbi:MAG: hypothetical protein R3F39_04405 [Myxococcota bacterium]
MQRPATYLLALLAPLALGACSEPRPDAGFFVGAATLFEAAVAPAGTRLLPLDALRVPANAELQLTPAWFSGALPDASPGRGLQLVVRARHADGAFTTIPLGPPTPGDGSRPIPPGADPARATIIMGDPQTAPLAARDVIALELFVATLPPADPDASPVGRARVGAAALFEAPPPRTTTGAGLAALEAATRSAGGHLALALRVPVTLTPAAAPCANSHRLVALEADPSPRRGAGPGDLDRLDRAWQLLPSAATPGRPATRAGIPLAGLSALAIDLAITVPDHTLMEPRAPRPERRRRGDPREERYWEVPPQRDVTANEPLRASRYRHLARSAIGTAP